VAGSSEREWEPTAKASIHRILFEVLNDLRPLARWDGLHLVFDVGLLERHLRQRIAESEHVSDLSLGGEGDAVRLSADVIWKGLSTRVRVDVTEIRLKRRFLGFRLRRPKAFGGVPVPRGALELLIGDVFSELVVVFRGEGIVVVDLRRWIPYELDFSVLTVQATVGRLHVWLGPGSLSDLPADPPPVLPADTRASDS
jgi:hypothetical protein